MMFQMLAVLAEFERNLTAERTTTALQHKKRTGQKYTNQTPYGFEAIEGRLVQVLAGSRGRGRDSGGAVERQHPASIADNLNGRGIPTKTGKQWAPATIHLLLKRSSLVNSI
jgi:site-specific DNA recombinase